jgi:hypothetical protein
MIRGNDWWRGFDPVVKAAGWHTGDTGSILGREGLYTSGLHLSAVRILGMDM